MRMPLCTPCASVKTTDHPPKELNILSRQPQGKNKNTGSTKQGRGRSYGQGGRRSSQGSGAPAASSGASVHTVVITEVSFDETSILGLYGTDEIFKLLQQHPSTTDLSDAEMPNWAWLAAAAANLVRFGYHDIRKALVSVLQGQEMFLQKRAEGHPAIDVADYLARIHELATQTTFSFDELAEWNAVYEDDQSLPEATLPIICWLIAASRKLSRTVFIDESLAIEAIGRSQVLALERRANGISTAQFADELSSSYLEVIRKGRAAYGKFETGLS